MCQKNWKLAVPINIEETLFYFCDFTMRSPSEQNAHFIVYYREHIPNFFNFDSCEVLPHSPPRKDLMTGLTRLTFLH